MLEVGVARGAQLGAVRLHREHVGAVEQILVDVGIVGADPLDQAEGVEVVAGDDQRVAGRQLAQPLEGAGVEVDLVGGAEPLVGGGPLGHRLDVQVVLDGDVLDRAVAAAGAAAEGQRRREVVVDAAEGAHRGGRVDDDPAGVHGLVDLLLEHLRLLGAPKRRIVQLQVIGQGVVLADELLDAGLVVGQAQLGKQFRKAGL